MSVEHTYSKFRSFFDAAHADGALDAKTKELIHLAVVLALHCEPWAVTHFAVAKNMGCTDEEIQEAVQCAYSVGAGVMWAMADRAKKASDERFRWWDKQSVQRAITPED